MRKVIFKTLNIENWRGMTFSVNFNEDKTIVRGTNGTGKSHINDAIQWVVTGVDSLNRTNYNLYDERLPLTVENAIPAVVELVMNVDGTEYAFKRSAKQKWTRPRGSAEYRKEKSDEYLYYVDGLAVSAKKYWDVISELFANVDRLKLMLNVRHYLTLDWKELRQHFGDMVGIIDESEMKGDYTIIKPLVEKHKTVAAAKEKLKQEIDPIDRDFDELTRNIKADKQALPDISGVPDAEEAIKRIESEIESIDKSIIGLGDANKPYVEKRNAELKAIEGKRMELNHKRDEWNNAQRKPVNAIQEQIVGIEAQNRKIQADNAQIERNRKNLENQIKVAEEQAAFFQEELERLRAENRKIKERVFDDNATCPTCGQKLPEAEVAKLRNDFYDKKESDHKDMVERGTKMADRYNKQVGLVEKYKNQLTELPALTKVFDATELEMQLAEAKAAIIPFESADGYKGLTKEIDDMEANLTVIPEVDSTELQERKKHLMAQLKEQSGIVALKKIREEKESEIFRHESKKTAMGIQLAHLKKLLAKCIEHEREWASIVRDRANRYLSNCSVEMLDFQKDGSIRDVCTISIDEVDVSVTNTHRQLVAGIDIAEAFQTNAELNLPIVVDNAEQIVNQNIPTISNQLILTYVDESYPELTVE